MMLVPVKKRQGGTRQGAGEIKAVVPLSQGSFLHEKTALAYTLFSRIASILRFTFKMSSLIHFHASSFIT